MTQARRGFFETLGSFPRPFWVANTMEIFERMSWYGLYMVMALYVTAPRESGGLGFSTETRGNIQAVVPFLLYVFPVLFGALADRYGYKKMFTIAFLIMIVAYYLLGQVTTVPTFVLAFLLVAVGAGMFKPIVVGTVSRVTDDANAATGFGIFYMMVNIGGFLGPIVAGSLRRISWDWVFISCSAWAAVNLLILLLFFQEPTREAASASRRTLRQVLDGMVEVLGNVRFGVTVFVVLVAMMLANTGKIPHFSWYEAAVFYIPGWLLLNVIYDLLLPSGSGRPANRGGTPRPWYAKRMYCSDWRFAVYLLILSGFWTSFNQLYLVMPEYIRDFVETQPVIRAAEKITFAEEGTQSAAAENLATINDAERKAVAAHIAMLVESKGSSTTAAADAEAISRELVANKVRIEPAALTSLVDQHDGDVDKITDAAIARGRQVNPEFIGNIDAFSIILFQVLISYIFGRFHRFWTMVAGILVAGAGWVVVAFAGGAGMVGVGASVWIVLIGIVTFAIGEMMASPTSQEYVSRIAPKERAAVYMGYYFIAIALGNLFGGMLSGVAYGRLARDMNRPDLMWLLFAGIFFATALAFIIYNIFALPKSGLRAAGAPEHPPLEPGAGEPTPS